MNTETIPQPMVEGLAAASAPGQVLRERVVARTARQSGEPIRLAYVTSLREIESEGVGGLIARERDTLYALQSYRLNGHVPAPADPATQHLYHALGQTYRISLVIADDDFVSPRMGSRLGTTALASYVHPSSGWRTIRDPQAKAFAKAQYEWTAFSSKRLIHDFDLVISDSYRMLFGPTALTGRLFTCEFGVPDFARTLERFNQGVPQKIEMDFHPEDLTALAQPGASVSRNGFTIRHEADEQGRSLNRLGLYTLPMAGLILNIHPAYTADLPGYTPTSDAIFRHALLRRANSSENFVVRAGDGFLPVHEGPLYSAGPGARPRRLRDERGQPLWSVTREGERFYRIPLHDAYLFSARNPRDLLFELAERRITGLSAADHARLSGASAPAALDGMSFQAVKEGTVRDYRLRARNGAIQVFENEAARARALFVQRRSGPFRDTSVQQDASGRWWLITPIDGERGRFLSTTGATLHYVDAGIDTGQVLRFSRSTPIRNSDSSQVARPSERPPRPTREEISAHSYRDGEQRLRERNYDTKSRTLTLGLYSVLRRRDIQERVQADRQAREAVRAANPAVERAHYRASRP
ncbi:MAG: hypothetical protein KGH63_00590 [Candidatus Micrarchaeota archaeon]|nr:hypothetical protein [Candidatus Micrarchaeota archaeon]